MQGNATSCVAAAHGPNGEWYYCRSSMDCNTRKFSPTVNCGRNTYYISSTHRMAHDSAFMYLITSYIVYLPRIGVHYSWDSVVLSVWGGKRPKSTAFAISICARTLTRKMTKTAGLFHTKITTWNQLYYHDTNLLIAMVVQACMTLRQKLL